MKRRTGPFISTFALAVTVAASPGAWAAPLAGDGAATNANGQSPAPTTGNPEGFRLGEDIAARLFPDDRMGAVLSEQMNAVLSPTIMARQLVLFYLIKIGRPAPSPDTSDAAFLRAAHILDPGFDARTAKLTAMMQQNVVAVITPMLPDLRQAYAAALSHRFPTEQLRAIADFYATPAGAALARESLSLNRDSAMQSVMLQMQRRMLDEVSRKRPELLEAMTEGGTSPAGAARLSPEQQAQMMQTLGLEASPQ